MSLAIEGLGECRGFVSGKIFDVKTLFRSFTAVTPEEEEEDLHNLFPNTTILFHSHWALQRLKFSRDRK